MEIQIKLTDGGITYANAEHFDLAANGTLRVISDGDNVVYSPHYWQAYVVNPQSEDPLALDD